jgi:2-methylfumaryl-CoA isomerase
MYGLLKGLRVVEGAAFIAGPSCGLHLAQFGAEVLRFDNIGGGPDFGRWPLAADGSSLYWEGLNKGKKSIAIDLGSPAGRELAVALATAPGPEGGLFLTNYPVDGFLSYERLRAVRADVICVRVMGWPDGSPALDYTVNAAVGIPAMTGPAADPAPVNHVLPAWDLLAGAYAAFALLAAERDRRASGVGRELRIPLSDLAASSLSHMGFVAEVATTGRDRERLGNDLYGAFGRDFATRNGRRVMVCAITPRQWSGIVKTLGLVDAVKALEQELGVSFAKDEGLRFVHRGRLYPLFEVAFAARTIEELGPEFDQGGVTWAPYQTLHEAVTGDARLFSANPMFERILNPSGLEYPASGPAATLPGDARQPLVRAPRLGEHTDEILAKVLGLSAAAIGQLHDQRLVAQADT